MSLKCTDYRAFGVLLLLLLLAAPPGAAAGENTGPPRWIAELVSNLERKMAESEANIRRSDEILVKSRGVLEKAQRLHDAKAESIAQKAIDITEAAKAKSLHSQSRIRITLNTLKRLGEAWRDQADRSAIVYYTGKVDVQRSGETGWNTLGEDAGKALPTFQPGDRIRTGDGTADIRLLDDGSSVNVGKNSMVEIEAPNRFFVSAGIIAAGIKLHTVALLKSRFEVRTPSTVVVVRGTQFLVGASQSGDTEVTVTEGAVQVTNSAGTETVLVEAGHTVSVAQNGRISKPNEIDPKSIDRWWED